MNDLYPIENILSQMCSHNTGTRVIFVCNMVSEAIG